jgi:hypothetical protein
MVETVEKKKFLSLILNILNKTDSQQQQHEYNVTAENGSLYMTTCVFTDIAILLMGVGLDYLWKV